MTAQELNELAHTLAFEYAVSVIETHCINRSDATDEPGEWWDARSADIPIADECAYLQARGLVMFHPTTPTWIQLLDEDAVPNENTKEMMERG